MTDGEIAAAVAEHEEKQVAIEEANSNVCRIGRTILARTHRGEDIAILEHERVGFVRATHAPSRLVEVALIDRAGEPRCYIPTEALA